MCGIHIYLGRLMLLHDSIIKWCCNSAFDKLHFIVLRFKIYFILVILHIYIFDNVSFS